MKYKNYVVPIVSPCYDDYFVRIFQLKASCVAHAVCKAICMFNNEVQEDSLDMDSMPIDGDELYRRIAKSKVLNTPHDYLNEIVKLPYFDDYSSTCITSVLEDGVEIFLDE